MFVKKLDRVRRKIMPKVTQKLGKNHFKNKVKGTNKSVINNVLICRPNQRLGNLLLVTPLIQEIAAIFPNSKIDIIVKGNVVNQIFKEYKNINKIIILPRKPFKDLINYLKIFFSVKTKKYDLVINGDKGSSSGKILTYLANAKYKIFDVLEEQLEQDLKDDFWHMAKNSVYNFRYYLQQIGYTVAIKEMPSLCLKLNKLELKKGKELLNKTVNNPSKETISIFTYATGAKCYSKDWWSEFYIKLKENFSDYYNILEILPVENISQINFNASTFYSTDIREIASVIANTKIFIGADSGIMHLASASKVTTIGLFSVTSAEKYEPYNNNNISINTNDGTMIDFINTIDKKLNKI